MMTQLTPPVFNATAGVRYATAGLLPASGTCVCAWDREQEKCVMHSNKCDKGTKPKCIEGNEDCDCECR
jgi:hypothetical protein